MKKLTVDEVRMLLAALNHMQVEFSNEADEYRKANAVFSAQYYTERSDAYLRLYHKVSDMLDDICE